MVAIAPYHSTLQLYSLFGPGIQSALMVRSACSALPSNLHPFQNLKLPWLKRSVDTLVRCKKEKRRSRQESSPTLSTMFQLMWPRLPLALFWLLSA